MSILKQKLHRKNDAGTYDEIHLATDGSVVTMNNGGQTVEAAINNNYSLITNLSTEVSSLKTSVSNGKSAVASAITDKGVSTSATASFSTMASNIRKLSKPLTVPIAGSNFTYSGSYQVIDDGSSNWRIKFLTSGTFKPLQNMVVDIFLVGGGGGSYYMYGEGSGGGGGYTKTSKAITLYANTSYSIVIGAGGTSDTKNATASGAVNNGGKSSGFGIEVNGGSGGNNTAGGSGGSGGGAYGQASGDDKGWDGGSDGSNGGGDRYYIAGTGQGTTTREFGESTGDLYAGGGGGKEGTSIGKGGAGGGANGGYAATANTGGGGGGGGNGSLSDGYGGHGGSGIVIIRNKR